MTTKSKPPIVKTIILSILLILVCISCNDSKKEIDQLEIAKQYYNMLNTSDDSGIAALLTDSISMKETEYNYIESFSRKGYVEWLKWDAVFKPTYKILQIVQGDGIVKAKISKMDDRIAFLNEEPIVTNEVIRFRNKKIISIEKTKYLVFNETLFIKNRDALVTWIVKNHPELDGFLFDQTEAGGLKYLKAISFYKNRK